MRMLLAVLLSLTCTFSFAHSDAMHAKIAKFAKSLEKKHGLNKKQIEKLVRSAKKKQSIIDAMDRPAESKPWHVYRGYFIKPKHINNGVKFWDEQAELLAKAEEKYGVDQEIILGIIGVETRFGAIKGGYRVLDALYTLGFHYPKRGRYFRSELAQFLVMAHEEGLDPKKIEGSYAGAIGWPQFMPSSYRRYAVDFDGDGKRDLFHSVADAIGSVANYLKVHGWEPGQEIAIPAKINGKKYRRVLKWGIKPKKTMAQLKQYGVLPASSADEKLKAALFTLDNKKGEDYWLGLKNFYVITRYNRSRLYAMAVTQLGREVKQKRMQAKSESGTTQSRPDTSALQPRLAYRP